MRSKFQEITEKYKKIFENPEFAFELIQETISEIQVLPIRKRSQFVEIYKKIGQELFDRGIGVKNYDLDTFLQEIEDWKRGKKESRRPAKIVDFEIKLSLFVDCIKNIISKLRRYIILRVGKNIDFATKIFLLHDQHSYSPFLNSIRNKLQPDCEISEIKIFIKKLKEDKNFVMNNFILLVLFSPGSKSEEEGLELINELNGFFSDEIEQINITNYEKKMFEVVTDLNQIKEEIIYSIGTDLSNKQLTPDIEKIIKKLFKYELCDTIEYHQIVEGFSRAKVYEVQPFKQLGETTKYVIKVNDINNLKLMNEVRNFYAYVKSLDNRYTIEETTTESLRAIKYNYASDDGYTESEAFAQKLETPGLNLIPLVNNLFAIRLFRKWDDTKEAANITLVDYYLKYINLEKIIFEICSIENKDFAEIEKGKLITNLKKILSATIPVYLKICHGDLHTLNFFIDKKDNIFLIDFGDTEKHHAVIDHVALECSIKFRHIPKYISIKELLSIENNCLDIAFFDTKFDLSFIQRSDLKLYFQIINNIRALALPHIQNTGSKIDYFISLLMITFRQIRYKGLNQLYALRSAELLSEKIIQELKL